VRPKITFHLSLRAQAFLWNGSACRTSKKTKTQNISGWWKKTLRAMLNRRDYCWKCRCVYGENIHFDLKAWPWLHKHMGSELKMRKTILGMINLIEDYWNRKLTVHVLKFSEKSIRKLAEYSGIDSTRSFFCCQRMLFFCNEHAQQKPPQNVVCRLFAWSSKKKKSVLP